MEPLLHQTLVPIKILQLHLQGTAHLPTQQTKIEPVCPTTLFVGLDGTGSRTLSYGTDYEFAGGTAPTLTTTASAVDRIDYIIRSSTSIQCVFTANYS